MGHLKEETTGQHLLTTQQTVVPDLSCESEVETGNAGITVGRVTITVSRPM